MTDVVMIRFGEIFLKGENRPFFERRFLQNAQRAVSRMAGARVEKIHGRLLAFPGEGGMPP
ncbi:MAG TPA: tRNA 4-thiouridine(8) synthase ThiI, partial [Polyangia bacterium]|nr:tRNA 4-thiouridine(8) synthase ThiI [Polyangia bacterium]